MGIGGSTTEDKANEGESKKKTTKPSKRMEEEESKNVKSAVGGSEQRKDKKLPIKKKKNKTMSSKTMDKDHVKRMEVEVSKKVKSAVVGSEQRKDKKLPIKKRRATLEERRVLALETMADSMEALVRTTLIPKTKMMMQTKQFITKVFWSEVSVGACVAIAAFFAFHKNFTFQ